MTVAYRLLISSMFGVSALLAQQSPESPKVFQFGASQDEMYKVFGAPTKWYVSQTGRHLDSLDEFTAASKVWPAIEDVFMRDTPTNLYEIRVWWRADSRTSRLRPTMRVYQLDALVDKPAPAKAILSDVPEGFELCKLGCDLYGVVDGLHYTNYLLVIPSKPTAQQLKLGAELATDFKSEGTDHDFCIAIKLELDGTSAIDKKPPDWNNGKVVEIEIGARSLYYELSFPDTKAVRIGTWTP